jgi:EcsC protein family
MIMGMRELPYRRRGSFLGRGLNQALGFGVKRGLRSVEIKPDDFRRQLADKYGLWVPSFARMQDVPIERLDDIATALIRDAQRLAMLEGAGFGLGGMLTLMPDVSFLSVITLRLIQRLCLLYGFETRGPDERWELWLAAASAAGVDYGKDVAEKQLLERAAPGIARRLAVKIGTESAEKWVGRLIPLASSAIGGTLNFLFVRGWGRRVQANLRSKHLASRVIEARQLPPYLASQPSVN